MVAIVKNMAFTSVVKQKIRKTAAMKPTPDVNCKLVRMRLVKVGS